MLQGGRAAADKCHWPVWGALAVSWPHCVCPHSWVCAFPSTLLRLLPAPGPCIVCGSSFQVFHKRAGLHFVPSPAQAAQVTRSLMSTLSPSVAHLIPSRVPASVSAHAGRVLAPCVCSQELASSCDPPGRCRPSRISGSLWLETGSLFSVW